MLRRASIALALLVAACRGEPAKPASTAALVDTPVDGGVRTELVVGGRKVAVDDADPARREARGPAGGASAAYRTPDGTFRPVYAVGDALFVGAAVPEPAVASLPDLSAALGPLFAASPPARRAELVAAVRRADGDAGVAKLLVAAIGVADPAWDAAAKTLPPALLEGLGAGLEPGQPPLAVTRAAQAVDLGAPRHAARLGALARDGRLGAEAPATAAKVLRALGKANPGEAAEAACAILGRGPAERGGADPSLVEAAFYAVRSAACPAADAAAAAYLAEAMCQPSVRCDANGPLSYHSTSTQDEPLCTAAQIAAATDEPGRGALFAYGRLLAAGKVPEAFGVAHARRRYAVEQPKSPRCDSIEHRGEGTGTLVEGTPCRCEEPELRYQACRAAHDGKTQSGLCRFAIDDARKRLHDVTAAPNGVDQ